MEPLNAERWHVLRQQQRQRHRPQLEGRIKAQASRMPIVFRQLLFTFFTAAPCSRSSLDAVPHHCPWTSWGPAAAFQTRQPRLGVSIALGLALDAIGLDTAPLPRLQSCLKTKGRELSQLELPPEIRGAMCHCLQCIARKCQVLDMLSDDGLI